MRLLFVNIFSGTGKRARVTASKLNRRQASKKRARTSYKSRWHQKASRKQNNRKWQTGDTMNLDKLEVAHVVGSSQHKPPGGGSWRGFHEKHSGQKKRMCSILGCSNKGKKNTMGAHIWMKGKRQQGIIPTCYTCNQDPTQRYGNGFVGVKKGTRAVVITPHKNTFDYFEE